MLFSVFTLILLTRIVPSASSSSSFNQYWLDDSPALILNFNCTETEAGTLELSSARGHYPNLSFRKYITTNPSACPGVNRFYLNIRSLSLVVDDRLKVYENFISTTPDPVKILDGGFHWPYRNSTCNSSSVSQLVTKTDQISIEFLRSSSDDNSPTRSSELIIDYTIVRDKVDDLQRNEYVFCDSLKGFIRRPNLCDSSERVFCPTEYHASRTTDNPARGKGQRELCHGFPASLEVGVIVTLLVVGVFCICTAALLWYHCYKKRREKSMAESRVSYGTIQSGGLSGIPRSQPKLVKRTVGGIKFRHGSWTKSPLNGPPVNSL